MAARIRKGDDVIVLAGKDKGKRGTVLSVADDRVVVENIKKKRKKCCRENLMKKSRGAHSPFRRRPSLRRRVGLETVFWARRVEAADRDEG